MRATRPVGGLLAVAVVLAAWPGAAAGAPVPAKGEEERLREQALKFNDITGQEPMAGQILALLEDKEKSKKLLAAAHRLALEHAKAKKDAPFNINATYILADTAHRLKENDVSEYFYREYAQQALRVGSSEKLLRGYAGLIDLLVTAKRFADAEKVCKEFLEQAGDEFTKIFALRRMAQVLAKQGKADEAIKLADTLLRARPDQLLLHDLKGWVLREAGKFDDAAEVWEGLIGRVKKAKGIKDEVRDDFISEIRYKLSGVYVDGKRVEKAAEHLQALLEKEPNNPTYNNDLGFIWADHDMNLEKAEKLIRKALEEDRKLRRKVNPAVKPEQDKDSAAYLDSLGWVLYKQKKYKEALEALLGAVKQDDGQHLEIYDHLAEVHVALGQLDKAVDAWKKGLKCDPVSRRDEQRKVEVEKKIKKQEQK